MFQWYSKIPVFLIAEDSAGKWPENVPQVAFLPDPPTKPTVSEVTPTSVHLSWAPGRQHTQLPVEKFYVEYFGYESTKVCYL